LVRLIFVFFTTVQKLLDLLGFSTGYFSCGEAVKTVPTPVDAIFYNLGLSDI
jgi:hypothetical protein